MKFSDEQLKFIILQFSKGLSAIAVKRKFLQTYVIWGRQRSKFTLTNFQRACGVSICNGRFTFSFGFLSQDRNFQSNVLWSDAKKWVLDQKSYSQNDRIWARRMIKNQQRAQNFFLCSYKLLFVHGISKFHISSFTLRKIILIGLFSQNDSLLKGLIGFGTPCSSAWELPKRHQPVGWHLQLFETPICNCLKT